MVRKEFTDAHGAELHSLTFSLTKQDLNDGNVPVAAKDDATMEDLNVLDRNPDVDELWPQGDEGGEEVLPHEPDDDGGDDLITFPREIAFLNPQPPAAKAAPVEVPAVRKDRPAKFKAKIVDSEGVELDVDGDTASFDAKPPAVEDKEGEEDDNESSAPSDDESENSQESIEDLVLLARALGLPGCSFQKAPFTQHTNMTPNKKLLYAEALRRLNLNVIINKSNRHQYPRSTWRRPRLVEWLETNPILDEEEVLTLTYLVEELKGRLEATTLEASTSRAAARPSPSPDTDDPPENQGERKQKRIPRRIGPMCPSRPGVVVSRARVPLPKAHRTANSVHTTLCVRGVVWPTNIVETFGTGMPFRDRAPDTSASHLVNREQRLSLSSIPFTR